MTPVTPLLTVTLFPPGIEPRPAILGPAAQRNGGTT